jgi:nickel-dependent lactate racemase
VVASIGGGDREQTWDNVARALAAAGRAVTDDGSIAMCTDLASGPGPALMRLRDAQDIETAQRQIRHEHSYDARPAAELAHALERGSVYLLSRLEDEVVEQLGMAPVADGEQIARLAHRSDSCILLANAQHAVPTAEDE